MRERALMKISKVIDRLVSYIAGEIDLSAEQLETAHILLNKFLPDPQSGASDRNRKKYRQCNGIQKTVRREMSEPLGQKQVYFEAALAQAQEENRIKQIDVEPSQMVYTYWDLGVSDLCSIWVVQYMQHSYHLPIVHVINYYEAAKTSLFDHLRWLRAQSYSDVTCVLPHDGAHRQLVTAKTIEAHIQTGGFATKIIPNWGKGAAQMRIEAVNKLMPSCWFHVDKCQIGLKALAHYHEQTDRKGQVKAVPSHDWASHAADAFGLMAVDYEDRFLKK